MITRIFISALVLFLPLSILEASPSQSEYVEGLIESGALQEAAKALGEIETGSAPDWKAILLQGMIQPEGELSISSLEKALLLCPEGCEEIAARLAGAYFSLGEYDQAIRLYEDWAGLYRGSERDFPLLWFAALSYIRKNDFEKAAQLLKRADKLSGHNLSWREILRADCQYLSGHKKDAVERLNEVIASAGGASFAALYNRTYFYAKDGDRDRALTGFNMLKEAHADFLGLAELLDLLEGREAMGTDGAAEKITGVRYTIQIGTYAEKEELDKLANRLRQEGWSTYQSSRFVDGRKYWILTVGSFQTMDKAQRTKKILEVELKMALKLVIQE